MALNPETLLEDTLEQRQERESRTGVIGDGHKVWCQPYDDDPEIFHQKDRLVCLSKPYSKCGQCPHSKFEIVFDQNRRDKVSEPIACPRWERYKDKVQGKDPDYYSFVSLGICTDTKPLPYCGSCPSKPALVQLGLDKSVPGWYGRFRNMGEDN